VLTWQPSEKGPQFKQPRALTRTSKDNPISTGNGSPTRTTSGAYSTSTGSGSACGAAPAPTISGFKAETCGDPNFDRKLDDALGYVDFDTEGTFSDVLKEIAPGLNEYDPEHYGHDDVKNSKRDSSRNSKGQQSGIHKRLFGFSVESLFQYIGDSAVSFVKGAGEIIKDTVDAGVQLAKDGIKAVGDMVDAVTNPSIETTINLRIGPKDLVQTPFGEAYEIYGSEHVNLSCVGCGASGEIHAEGAISFSFRKSPY
jgi:hypothetical protein